MEIIYQAKLKPYLSIIKWGLILTGLILTSLLSLKDLYFYTWDEKMETIIYSIPMVFIFFLWLRFRLDEQNIFQHQLLLIDATVVALAGVRILGLLFHSGHVLFLLYTIMTAQNKSYQWIAILMLGFTIYLKIFYWGDFLTPTIGGLIAFLFIWIRKKYSKRINSQSTPNL